MKAKDQTKVRAIRSVLAALGNAEAIAAPARGTSFAGRIAGAMPGLGAGDVPRKYLSELDVLDILDREITDRLTTANQYDALGQTAKASELRAEAAIVRSFLG